KIGFDDALEDLARTLIQLAQADRAVARGSKGIDVGLTHDARNLRTGTGSVKSLIWRLVKGEAGRHGRRQLVRRAEMSEIAGLDRLDRENDQDIGGAELVVDDRAVAVIGAEPEISLDQRRQRFQRGTRVDRRRRQHVHVDAKMLVRSHAPIVRRERVMVEEAQRGCMYARVGALEARTSDHHVDAVLAYVRPHPLPQELKRALVAVRLDHAEATELHEAVVAALR